MSGKPATAPPDNRIKFRLAEIGSRPVPACLLLAVVTVAAFFPVTGSQFINCDDPLYITSNPVVESGLTWRGVEWAFRTTHAVYWQPMTWLSLMLDVSLFGNGPVGPHVTNLLLHAANGILVFLILRRWTRAPWPSAFAAALFALHPLRVESVAWATERKDVLSGFFFLLTLFAYTRYARSVTSDECRVSGGSACPSPVTRHRSLFYRLALFFFAGSLMSKPMAVTLPFVLLLLDYWPLERLKFPDVRLRSTPEYRRSWVRLLLEKIPFAVIALASSVVTWQINRDAGNTAALTDLSFPLRAENAVVSYARYLGKTLWPFNLSVFYPYPHHWPWPQIGLAAALMILLCLAAIMLARRLPFVFTGWFWFAGMLVPVIGLTQTGIQSMADRFTYIPSIGIAIVIAWSAAAVLRRYPAARPFVVTLSLLILAAGGVRTWNQSRDWQNSETLFRHAIAVTTGNSFAWFNLGCTLNDSHRSVEAAECFRKTIEISPNSAESYNQLANALLAQGQVDEAINNYRKAVFLNPTNSDAAYNLGNALLNRGEVEDAITAYRLAAKIEPDSSDIQNNLGAALERAGRIGEAITYYAEAARLRPDNADLENNLGVALAKSGNLEAALPHFTAAVRIDTNNVKACCNLGHALASKGQTDEAVRWYRRALEIKPAFFDAADLMGDASAEKGDLSTAVDGYRRALQDDPRSIPVHLKLARVLARTGQMPEAIRCYRETLQLDPDCAEAKQQLQALGTTPAQ